MIKPEVVNAAAQCYLTAKNEAAKLEATRKVAIAERKERINAILASYMRRSDIQYLLNISGKKLPVYKFAIPGKNGFVMLVIGSNKDVSLGICSLEIYLVDSSHNIVAHGDWCHSIERIAEEEVNLESLTITIEAGIQKIIDEAPK